MRSRIKTALSTLASIAVFAMALTVQAQTTTGTIYGTITDPSGAAIPGCTVKVVDTATGVAQTAVTNDSGAYTFSTVDPGDYSVSTTATGFKNLTQTGVQVAANQNVHVAFKLPVGSATENVSVAAGVTMVDTREAQIATTIEQQELQQLPSENRDVYSLAFAVPAGPYGDERQRSLVGPGNIDTDLALFKEFPIYDNVRLLFRAEAFNAFGNVNLNNPKTGLTMLNAGLTTGAAQITGAAPPRIWQFAAKLRF